MLAMLRKIEVTPAKPPEPTREFRRQPTNRADDAEGILRGVEESSTPWILIRSSNLFLGLATEHRQKVEAARQTYGSDVPVVG
jgi:hypothetical protein